jgi:Subtilase family/Peptidase inhibitor I9
MIGWRKARLAAVTLTAASVVLTMGTSAYGTPAGAAPGTAAAAAPGAGGAPVPVIVVLKNQLTAVPADAGHLSARRQQTAAAQQPLIALAKAAGATHVTSYVLGNAFSATVSPALEATLAAEPSVASVVPDQTVQVAPASTAAPTGPTAPKSPEAAKPTRATGTPAASATQGPDAICPADPAKPLLEPEALYSMHVAGSAGAPGVPAQVDGAGVKVGLIADGLDPNDPDFIRADGQHVVADYEDFSGSGTTAPTGGAEAFGDASSIAAQGRVSYDLSQYVNPAYPLPSGCTIRIQGVAPGASLVVLKADGTLFSTSSILQAINYAVTVAHVDVLNESFIENETPDSGLGNTLGVFNGEAAAAGVTVVASSGDAGVTGTIGNPASDPNVISVGASTDSQLYEQTGYALAKDSNGTWANDNISALSSGGYTQTGGTVDLVAPGEANWALCSTDVAVYSECTNYAGQPSPIQAFGGTSEAAPLTAGAAALVIEAYRNTHHGASPTPALVKQLLEGTAQDLGLPSFEQGAGLVDARAAVQAAEGYHAAPSADHSLAVTTSQLDVTGHPGSQHSESVTVVNTGSKPTTVGAATRTFAPLGSTQQTVQLNSSTDQPFVYPTNGAAWVEHKVTFSVPRGAARLSAAIAWQGAAQPSGGTSVTPVVRLTLLDPSGRFETNTRPQGGAVSANYGLVDVAQPVPGSWTAILYTAAGTAGFTGPVLLDTSTQRTVPDGTVSPRSLTVAPGRSATFQVRLTTPLTSGDSSESVDLTGSNGQRISVPVTLRALVDTSSGTGRFSGTITGGNARQAAQAQTSTYAFDVPPGRKDIEVGLTLDQDSDVAVQGVLISPDNTPIDSEGNYLLNAQGVPTGTGPSLSTTALNPVPGRWRFVVEVVNPVSGAELSQRYTGSIAFDRDHATAQGLPNDTATHLVAGKAVTVPVTYRNTTGAPQWLGVEGRLDTLSELPLVPVGPATVPLPVSSEFPPDFVVPPGTTALQSTSVSSTPAQLELENNTGLPDVFGDLASAEGGATTSVASSAAGPGQQEAPGEWTAFVQQIGPFPVTGAPTGSTTVTASVLTQGFDPAVTSAAGDPFASAVDATAAATHLVEVQPGGSVTIPVTVTPGGAKGSQVHGVLYLVSAPGSVAAGNEYVVSLSGDVLAALPYSYTIG